MVTLPDDHYRVCVVRRGPVGSPADLGKSIDWLLAALNKMSPVAFQFSGLTPAYDTVLVKDAESDNLPKFLASSQIDYPFGRNADDPTHSIRFFHAEGDDQTYVDMMWSWSNLATSNPELVAEIRLGTAPPAQGKRGAWLVKIFELLIRAVQPDFGFVELPRPLSPSPLRPIDPVFRWCTYLSKKWPTIGTLPPPSVALSLVDYGTLLFATSELNDEVSSDVARAVEALENAVRPMLFPRGSVVPPNVENVVPVAIPTFMRPRGFAPLGAPTDEPQEPADTNKTDPQQGASRPSRSPPAQGGTAVLELDKLHPPKALPFQDEGTTDLTSQPGQPATPFEKTSEPPPPKKK